MTPVLASVGALFAIADYRRLWAVGGLIGVSRWLEFLTLSVYAYELTGSPQLVALLTIVRVAPYVFLGFAVGALADTFDRRRLLLAGLWLALAVSGGMSYLTATGQAGYLSLVTVALVSGLLWVMDMPVRRQLLVEAAPQQMTTGLGFDSSTSYATRAVGPLVGGGAYQWLGMPGIFALNVLVFLACVLLTWRIVPARTPSRSVGRRTFALTMMLPPRELLSSRPFMLVLGVTLVYNLWCFPIMAMVPVIAQKDFGLSPAGVGALSACEGLGGALGSIAVGLLVADRTLFRTHFLGVVANLGVLLVLALAFTAPGAFLAITAMGVAAAGFSATQYALLYIIAPPELRGRATGFLSIIIGSGMVGLYHAGWLFARYSSPDAMMIMASEGLAVMLALGILWWWLRPQFGTRAAAATTGTS